jgi:esterase
MGRTNIGRRNLLAVAASAAALGSLRNETAARPGIVRPATKENDMTALTFKVYGRGAYKAVALHSLFADGSSFLPLMSAFDPEKWSVALLDVRGYGRSKALPGPFNLGTVATDALAVTEHLGWKEFSIIGHSMGGKAALKLADEAKGKVRRIIGLSPIWAGSGLYSSQQIAFLRSTIDDVKARMTIMGNTTGNQLSAYWYSNMADTSSNLSTKEAYSGYVESLIDDDFEHSTRLMDMPVLVIGGAEDQSNLEMIRNHWSKLKNVKTIVLEGCGHWALQEMPLRTGAIAERFLVEM